MVQTDDVRRVRLIRQFVQFAAAGLVGTAAHYAVLFAGVEGLGAGAVESSSAGYCTGALINYALARRFVFRSSKPIRHTAWRFALVTVAGMALNAISMNMMTNGLGMHYFLAQLLSTAAVLAWNFTANKWWSFR